MLVKGCPGQQNGDIYFITLHDAIRAAQQWLSYTRESTLRSCPVHSQDLPAAVMAGKALGIPEELQEQDGLDKQLLS